MLRNVTRAQQQVIQDVLQGKTKTLRVKENFVPNGWFQTTLLIDVLAVSPINVLFLQNLGLDDFQLNRLIDVLVSNRHIVAVNLGEVGEGVSRATWERLMQSIPDTNVCFMYVSENQAGPRITAELKARVKRNKDKTTSRFDWRSVDFPVMDIVKMWWTPSSSKYKRSIP